jgi:two-component system, cell cycle sensor histidine kinase and response regulator CckA
LECRTYSLPETPQPENDVRFLDFLEEFPDAAYQRNLQSDAFEFITPAIEALTGFPAEEFGRLRKQEILARIHPEDLPAVREAVRGAVVQSGPGGTARGSIDYRFLQKNGVYRWLTDRFTVCTDMEGAPLYRIGIVRDSSERKKSEEELRQANELLEKRVAERTSELAMTVDVLQAEFRERGKIEERLRESEERYRSIFDSSIDGIILSTPEGNLLAANPAACRMFGMTEEEMCLAGRSALIDAADPAVMRFYDEFERAGRASGEISCIRKDGSRFTCEQSSVLFRDSDGNERSSVILRNTTERKRMEQHLIQSQKMESIGLFAGGIAHDFNNLMTAIIGYGELIDEALDDGDELRENVSELLLAADRARDLTRNLLAFSRKQVLNQEPLCANEVVRGVSKLLTRLIGADINIVTNLQKNCPTILADRTQIEQVIVNLATNARDAMEDGGDLSISTRYDELDDARAFNCGLEKGGNYVAITVSDTGSGMDAATIERIFDPFFTTKQTGRGTGLGLSIIYGIIRQHNGAVTVESEPGIGSIFTMYLPAAARSEKPVKKREMAAELPQGGTETILLAEDDATVRKFLTDILERAGYRVVPACDGADAYASFLDNRDSISMVVTDVIMPRKNGKQLYDAVMATDPGMKFIFISGYTDDILTQKGLTEERLDLLLKPVANADLLRKVRKVLDSPVRPFMQIELGF